MERWPWALVALLYYIVATATRGPKETQEGEKNKKTLGRSFYIDINIMVDATLIITFTLLALFSTLNLCPFNCMLMCLLLVITDSQDLTPGSGHEDLD